MYLEPLPMRRLFRTVAADRHAAPSTRAASRMVGEHQRAGRALTCLHV
jgi:hypothetical protein